MGKGCLISSIIGGGIAVVIFIFVMWVIGAYNSIITLNETATTAWSQVENQYQRRFDLIPNLVETVKGVANFEKGTFIAVAEARSSVGSIKLTPEMLNDPKMLQKFQAAQDGLSGALSKLMVVVEKYPELKANKNFLQLQSQLEGTENRIAVERKRFNDSVKEYNVKVKRFPGNILAGFFGFKERPYFEATEGADKAPVVKLEFNNVTI